MTKPGTQPVVPNPHQGDIGVGLPAKISATQVLIATNFRQPSSYFDDVRMTFRSIVSRFATYSASK
jgi:hypothetical protein